MPSFHCDATSNGYEKESTENSTATLDSELERVKDQMAAKELEGTENISVIIASSCFAKYLFVFRW